MSSESVLAVLADGIIRMMPKEFKSEYGGDLRSGFRLDLRTRDLSRAGIMEVLKPVADLIVTLILEWARVFRRPGRKKSDMNPSPLNGLLRDLRFASRSLVKEPAFTLSAIAILGIAMASNASVFMIAERVFFTDPPGVVQPERIVRINRTSSATRTGALSFPDFADYREQSSAFTDMAAFTGAGTVSLVIGEQVASVRLESVSASYFTILGVQMAAGRTFLESDDRAPIGEPVTVISHSLWRRVFDADSSIVGRTVNLNGKQFTVVGITQPEFASLGATENPSDMWIPLRQHVILDPSAEGFYQRVPDNINRWLYAIGRLRNGVTVEEAQANLDVIAERLAVEYADWSEGQGVAVYEHFGLQAGDRKILLNIALLLGGAAALVLLIGASNIALLSISRGIKRQHEVGIRVALGAGRARVMRELLVESMLLALASAVVGISLSLAGRRLVFSFLPVSVYSTDISIVKITLFALGLILLTVLLFGLLPVLKVGRVDPSTLMSSGRSEASGSGRLNGVLVVGQVFLATIVVTGGVLFSRSLKTATDLDLGFQTENRYVLRADLQSHGYSPEQARTFMRTGIDRINSIPGAEATLNRMTPFLGYWGSSIHVEGHEGDSERGINVGMNSLGPGYFRMMGIDLLAGREFEWSDDAGSERVAIINQHAATSLFQGRNPIGATFTRSDEVYRVVGVAADATYYELGEEPQLLVYVPLMQEFIMTASFLVKTDGSVGLDQIRDELHVLDRTLAFSRAMSIGEVVASELSRYRVSAMLVGTMSIIALILAASGLYGLLSYRILQRRKEYSIRMALGATSTNILAGSMRWAVSLAGSGILVGIITAFVMSRFVGSFLFGISPRDPVTFAVAPVLLLAVAAAASMIPARRVLQVEPVESLKE